MELRGRVAVERESDYTCIMNPRLFIIAGCNGAGKTTASFSLLPEVLNCRVFINADEIARELCPQHVESVAFEAGRVMLEQINEKIRGGETFAFETTLSARSYRETILLAQALNYHVTLLFFWLESVEMAIERVKKRVEEGGHNIENDVIKRRYTRGLKNLFEIYLPLVSDALVIDGSTDELEKIATSAWGQPVNILNSTKWEKLKKLSQKKK